MDLKFDTCDAFYNDIGSMNTLKTFFVPNIVLIKIVLKCDVIDKYYSKLHS